MSKPTTKRIDIQSGKFEANGKTYYIYDRLDVRRYVEYLKMSNELFFGVTFKQLYDVLMQIWKTASSGNDLLAANHKCRELAYNQINSIVDFTSRDHPSVLRFCALFCNREDEKIEEFDDRLIDSKIQDWMEEGLDIEDFFYLAAKFNPEFKKAFAEHHPDAERIREEAKKKNASSPTDTTTPTSKKNSE